MGLDSKSNGLNRALPLPLKFTPCGMSGVRFELTSFPRPPSQGGGVGRADPSTQHHPYFGKGMTRFELVIVLICNQPPLAAQPHTQTPPFGFEPKNSYTPLQV
jgi:hypothetical protein